MRFTKMNTPEKIAEISGLGRADHMKSSLLPTVLFNL